MESLPEADRIALAELADMSLMRELHRRIEDEVDDPATAESLKPWHGMLCKRPTTNDDYLAAFNQETVHLLADPGGVEALTENGIAVGGEEHVVDCVIFATGFETGTPSADRYGLLGKPAEKNPCSVRTPSLCASRRVRPLAPVTS